MAEKKIIRDLRGHTSEEDLELEQDEPSWLYDDIDRPLEVQKMEDRVKEAIRETPFGEMLADSRSKSFFMYIEGYTDGICLSFRFDVGNGFYFDWSSMDTARFEMPEIPDPAEAVRLLETILPIVPRMRDGVEIENDNYSMDMDTAYDLFKNSPPGRQLWDAGAFAKCHEEDVGEFDGMPIARLDYFESASYYAVYVGRIRVFFPRRPTDEDLEWVSSIKTVLAELDKLMYTSLRHFNLWQDSPEGRRYSF